MASAHAATVLALGTVSALSLHMTAAFAQQQPTGSAPVNSLGVNTQGVTGGLVIPSAHVLSQGTVAATYGNFQESQLGLSATQQNLSLGFGLLPGLEMYGRLAEYVDPIDFPVAVSGRRDLSVNVKLQVPTPWAAGPKVAFGVNDIAGGAAIFKSLYLVTTQQFGAVTGTVGYAQGSSAYSGPGQIPTFNGLFGGAAWRVGDTGLSLLAEHDGRQRHAGVRWQSPPIAALARAQVVGTVQQSFGAVTPLGINADATKFSVSVVVPIGDNEVRLKDYKPSPAVQLPALATRATEGGLQATPEDSLASIRKALVGLGLERLRVGQRQGLLGPMVIIEYENHRYAHNEADALGLVLGVGAELAPAGTQRVLAVTLKDGVRQYETSVGVAAYREFLRDGSPSPVRDSLIWDRVNAASTLETRWLDETPTGHTRVRVELRPDLNTAVGTEIGLADYSLAANVVAIAPLWRGARLQGNYVQQFANTPNMAEGAVLAELRQKNGLKSLALQQSFWLGNSVLAQLAAGRFHHDVVGVQGEAMAFVPGTENLLRARAVSYNQAPGGLVGGSRAMSVSYRHALAPATFIEAGFQGFGDGSAGPTVEWTRWYGDFSVQLFYRRGGDRQFAGLQLSFPLTGRQGMAPGPVTLSGEAQHAQALRTRITTASEPQNLVQPSAVRDISLESNMDGDLRNAGRASQRYFVGQIHRMREVFYIYAVGRY